MTWGNPGDARHGKCKYLSSRQSSSFRCPSVHAGTTAWRAGVPLRCATRDRSVGVSQVGRDGRTCMTARRSIEGASQLSPRGLRSTDLAGKARGAMVQWVNNTASWTRGFQSPIVGCISTEREDGRTGRNGRRARRARVGRPRVVAEQTWKYVDTDPIVPEFELSGVRRLSSLIRALRSSQSETMCPALDPGNRERCKEYAEQA